MGFEEVASSYKAFARYSGKGDSSPLGGGGSCFSNLEDPGELGVSLFLNESTECPHIKFQDSTGFVFSLGGFSILHVLSFHKV